MHCLVEDAGDPFAALFRCFGTLLDADDAIAAVQCGDRDARSHQSSADDADGFNSARGDCLQTLDLAGGAFGEEDMAQSSRLLAIAKFDEGATFFGKSFRQRSSCSKADEADGFDRRTLTACLAQRIGCCLVDGLNGLRWNGEYASATRRGSDGYFDTRNGVCEQGALGNPIENAELERFGGRNDASASDHIDGGGGADEARQALCSAGAGHDAELDFRQAELGGRSGMATMAGKRYLEAAAERCAIDGCSHGLRKGFDAGDDIRQQRLDRRLAEFLDVGAADEAVARACQYDAGDCALVLGMIERRHQAGPDIRRERVDGRIVYGDDKDPVGQRRRDGLRKAQCRHDLPSLSRAIPE